jgi:hypothetical protein
MNELAVINSQSPAVIAGIAVEADVRVDIAVFGFVDDFSAEFHSVSSFMVNGVENERSKVLRARSQVSDSSFQES